MATDEGATPRELVLEAARRNNSSLLNEVLGSMKSTDSLSREEAIADLINNTVSPTGLTPLHVAASTAAYDVLDILLDQENVEADPLTRRDLRTPLHLAVLHCNEEQTADDWKQEGVFAHVEILVEAGCDARTRDKHKLKPLDLVDPRNEKLRELLRSAEMQALAEEDAVEEDDDEGGDGPPSDSD